MAGDPLLRIVDAQAGGDVSRVIIGGAPALRGRTAAAQCTDFAARFDHLRRKLITPPHGALHMCPVLLLPALAEDSDLGVIIMESMGYPPVSGSNLFCAAAVALEYGFVTMHEPRTRLRIETPGGIIAMTASCTGGRCRSVEFENAPARIVSTGDLALRLPGVPDSVPVAVVSAGVDYAAVAAGTLGVSLVPESHDALVESGRRLAQAAKTDFVLFYETPQETPGGSACRIAVFQNPSVICRSPTGTGTSAMLTLAHAGGWLGPERILATTSPSGSVFRSRVLSVDDAPDGPLLRTAVSGDVAIEGETRIA